MDITTVAGMDANITPMGSRVDAGKEMSAGTDMVMTTATSISTTKKIKTSNPMVIGRYVGEIVPVKT
eukprot:CAMPEP_0185732488 /NCGR_PEP_ID=MMETSP1171-20130828/16411_1 /TAXON_ID=374046 /ORGANISM="Helicotheca tamensis, Strain CCMP826" /LENGTH=66 /DNA_ID=CAMNT_0028401991 /DNA_START=145 /DNA_END=345 /DNA_ORIENTATION=+